MDENGPPQNVSVSQWSELEKEGHLKMTTLTKTLTGENGEANFVTAFTTENCYINKNKKVIFVD